MNITLRIGNYIARYAPSERKLREYLAKKKFMGDITLLMEDIWYSEWLMLEMWMRTFLTRGTGKRDIAMKLMKKWFPKESIDTLIESSRQDIESWEDHEGSITRIIESLLAKKKSKTYIATYLGWRYPYFRDEIRAYLSWISDEEGLRIELEKYRRKYDTSDYKEKQKLFVSLQRKGFRYEEIRDILKEENYI